MIVDVKYVRNFLRRIERTKKELELYDNNNPRNIILDDREYMFRTRCLNYLDNHIATLEYLEKDIFMMWCKRVNIKEICYRAYRSESNCYKLVRSNIDKLVIEFNKIYKEIYGD